MKDIKIYCLYCLALVLLINPKIIFAQEWKWMNPKPQGNNLSSVVFTNALTGYAVGDYGTIIKTTDGGDSWLCQNSSTKQSLKCIYFLDENAGFSVGSSGTILKTEDTGNTWVKIPSGTDAPLREIVFTDNGIGYIVGWNGTILKSLDTGNTWSKINFTDSYGLEAISFINNNVAYAVGVEGALIRTLNSGLTWENVNFDLSLYTNDIYFVNADTGFIATRDGLFCTYDGGANWINSFAGNALPSSFFFINDSTGFVGSNGPCILKTTDYGISWTLDTISDEYTSFNSIYFQDSFHGYGVGYYGLISETDDAHNWHNKSERLSYSFNDMNFVDSETGYLIGDSSIIYVTEDGGQTFRKCYTGADDFWSLYHIEIPQKDVLIASGLFGKIAKSTDNGYHWSIIETGIWMNDIYFVSVDTGFAITEGYNSIIKTLDGGNTWSTIHPGFGIDLFNIQFVDNLHGYINGSSNNLIFTDDGGVSWYQKLINATKPLWGYYFVNNVVGYAASTDSTLFKTTDGGNNWYEIPLSTWYPVIDISFLNPDTGYVLKQEGEIFYTTDGGDNWTQQFAHTGEGVQISMTDKNTAYILGTGSLLKYGVSMTGIIDHPLSPKLEIQVYPNPVHQHCLLKYQLPKLSYVEISLLSSNGNKINTLFAGNKETGKHQTPLDFNNLPTGVYLIKIQTDYGIFTKKIVVK